jgi:subtilisin family serine protease
MVPGVLAVGATAALSGLALLPTTNLDEHAPYSNTGHRLVSFVAPGGISDPSILPGCQIFFAGAIRACWFLNAMHGLITPTGVYGNITGGTSAATAHASGVAALVIHAAGGNITPAQVEARMRDAAVDLGQPGKDAVFGHGRISAAAALEP